MASYAQLVPLIILIPALGACLNYLWGARLGEAWASRVAILASTLSFVIALLLYAGLNAAHGQASVVDPALLNGWIRIGDSVEIPWQMRVDTLSVTMMLFVSFVGTLIHIYAVGYMHGDPRFSRFFAYINMFLAFMFVLVTGNNFLMMFVGWEGVGVCSFLLIGFWFDKPNGEGWRNANAAKKAMIANRIGDFGMLMGIFLMFWTFGTLDYYRPGEVPNVHFLEEAVHEYEAEHAAAAATGDEGHAGEVPAEGTHGSLVLTSLAVAEAEGEGGAAFPPAHLDNEHFATEELGVFSQAERMLAAGTEVHFGNFSLPIETVLVLITLFLLLGAVGKSAQIPLFVWLPDAMAGPTPVSALIHAATMVTAGVYMMVRANVFFFNAPLTSFIVTLVGALTALLAGYIAMGQWDIKRVLAYSTISQLGFMVAAVGVGAYSAAMFHMVTHAFFKALLFLGSGSVIHGMEHGHHHVQEHGHAHGHGEFDAQDMRHMGGLRRRMPITWFTYLIGTLALAGIIPFAGFWSKDEILADSWLAGLHGKDLYQQFGGYIALAMLLLAATFTAFYMWRQMELVFYGRTRSQAAGHAPESVASMTVPLLILALFSVFIGFINTPKAFLGLGNLLGESSLTHFLEWSLAHVHPWLPQGGVFNPVIALIALALGITGIRVARMIYGDGRALSAAGSDPLAARPSTGAIWRLANARLYFDEFYFRFFESPFNRIGAFLADELDWKFWHDYVHDSVILRGFNSLSDFLGRPVDLGVVDGAVNGVGRLTVWLSGHMRRVQTGYVRMYAISLLLGVVFVILLLLLPLLQT